MRQTIPFKKDITFKTKIGELTAIALDNDLTLKGEDLITGNFYVSGTYKMLESSTLEEEYSYKIPCEIAISEEYDTYNADIDIDDFYYEIINDEVLRVNIVVVINNLERKEIEAPIFEEELEDIEILDLEEEEKINIIEEMPEINEKVEKEEKEELRNETNTILKAKENIKEKEETYLTYKVYIYKEEDTISKILEKYNITLEQLQDYNNLDDITEGSKLVIPSFND